jgi:hypothetical protein
VLARLVVLAALIAAVRPSHAQAQPKAQVKGWRHTPPEGYTASPSSTFVQYLKAEGAQYCLLGLYNPRPRTGDDAAEVAEEWRSVVLKTFTADTDQTLPARTTRNKLRYVTRTAALTDGKGGRSYGELHVVTTRAAIGSLLAVSGTPEAFEACRAAIAAVLDSLEEPAINPPSLTRAWGLVQGGGGGGARALYTLDPDGRYRFRSERRLAADRWLLVDEAGTWSTAPGRVTIKPTSSTAVERTRKTNGAARKLSLEHVTYAYKLLYLEATDEWKLVLSPPRATARDGAFTTDPAHPRSYVYSDRVKPAWQP